MPWRVSTLFLEEKIPLPRESRGGVSSIILNLAIFTHIADGDFHVGRMADTPEKREQLTGKKETSANAPIPQTSSNSGCTTGCVIVIVVVILVALAVFWGLFSLLENMMMLGHG